MSDPIFSAVIPAYNAIATLEDAVRSVLVQTRQDFELIVVDDGSEDATLELARTFESDSRVSVIPQRNRGLAGARNAGIARARGRYVGFLDSDDLWMPSFLEVLGDGLDDDPGAGFAYTDGWALDVRTGRIRRTTTMARLRPPAEPPTTAADFLRLLVRRNFIPAEALVRRRALEDVGSFDTSLSAAEDYELWLRMLSHGWRAVRPPGILLVRRDTPTSMSKDQLRMMRATLAVLQSVRDLHPAPADVKDTARERIRRAERELAMLEGRSPARRLIRRGRHGLGRLWRKLTAPRLWHRRPPAEVVAAFPDLGKPRP